jgi:hypothetical protein
LSIPFFMKYKKWYRPVKIPNSAKVYIGYDRIITNEFELEPRIELALLPQLHDPEYYDIIESHLGIRMYPDGVQALLRQEPHKGISTLTQPAQKTKEDEDLIKYRIDRKEAEKQRQLQKN